MAIIMQEFQILETFTTPICQDKEQCAGVNPDLCHQFPFLINDCPQLCQLCKCQDEKSCSGVSKELCEIYPSIKDKCRRTCGVCQDRVG